MIEARGLTKRYERLVLDGAGEAAFERLSVVLDGLAIRGDSVVLARSGSPPGLP
jgi:hypothetical protein